MEFEVAIYQLSAEFIRNYPSQQYPELMYKKGRPYSCLLIDLHLDYFICVPYRSSIHHKNAFFFCGTAQMWWWTKMSTTKRSAASGRSPERRWTIWKTTSTM